MEQAQASRRLLELLRAAPTVHPIRSPYVTMTVRRHQVTKAASAEKAVAWLAILTCSVLVWAAILSWLWGLLG